MIGRAGVAQARPRHVSRFGPTPTGGDSPNCRASSEAAPACAPPCGDRGVALAAAEVPEDLAQHPAQPAFGHLPRRRHAPLGRHAVDQARQHLAEQGEQAGPFHPGTRREPVGFPLAQRLFQFLRRDGAVGAGGNPALDLFPEPAVAELLDQGLQPRGALLPAHQVVQDLVQRRALQIVEGSAAQTRQELAHGTSSSMRRPENARAAPPLRRAA